MMQHKLTLKSQLYDLPNPNTILKQSALRRYLKLILNIILIMAESISIPQIPLFKNQGVNFKFLKTFEEFLRSQDLTNKSKILDTIYDHDVIIHYKKVIELAWNNFLKSGNEESKAAHVTPESSSVIYNCIVDFLVGISSYKIKLKIIFDGITPKAYTDVISTTSEEEESPHIDSLYPYDNFGASELVKAVQVLKDIEGVLY